MIKSGHTVFPQLFAEYMAFGIFYIQDEIEDNQWSPENKKTKGNIPDLIEQSRDT